MRHHDSLTRWTCWDASRLCVILLLLVTAVAVMAGGLFVRLSCLDKLQDYSVESSDENNITALPSLTSRGFSVVYGKSGRGQFEMRSLEFASTNTHELSAGQHAVSAIPDSIPTRSANMDEIRKDGTITADYVRQMTYSQLRKRAIAIYSEDAHDLGHQTRQASSELLVKNTVGVDVPLSSDQRAIRAIVRLRQHGNRR